MEASNRRKDRGSVSLVGVTGVLPLMVPKLVSRGYLAHRPELLEALTSRKMTVTQEP